MPERTISIASVRLQRSPMRLVLPSLILLTAAVIAGAAGLVVGSGVGAGLIVAAALLGLLSIYLAAMVLSVRLEVEVATLRVRWLGGERRYALARGPVTRVLLRGEGAVRLRARFGALGWAFGPAILRDAERIEIVRMAPSASVILVPTDRGRLGLAPASEAELIAALGAAARVQQRLDEVTGHLPVAAPVSVPAVPKPPPVPVTVMDGRLLTGIERAILEERLAADRLAALAAAEAERTTVRAAAEMVAQPVPAVHPSASPSPEQRDGPAVAPYGRRSISLPTAWRWAAAAPILFAAAPAVGAGALWLAAVVLGIAPVTEAEVRPAALALILAAGGLAGTLIARTWFPRLTGLVSISALAALVLIGRALLLT